MTQSASGGSAVSEFAEILDYGLSFIGSEGPENAVRFWVESRTRIVDERSGITEDYYQCGACKSEDTFAEKDLFYKDNYDFLPVFGPQYAVIFRRKAYLNANYRDLRAEMPAWGRRIYRLKLARRSRRLNSNAEIRAATHGGLPLVARTEIRNEESGLQAVLEYPVKTMNINDARDIYQVDTGPLAYPELSRRPEHLAETIRLAFVAFNVAHFADFVIEVPTPILKDGQEQTRVHHYSELRTLAVRNTLYCIEE